MKILIDKQKLLKNLQVIEQSCAYDNVRFYYFKNEFEKAAPENIMIPCSERLPEEHICEDGYVEPSEYCLVYENGNYAISRYWKNRKAMIELGNDYNYWTDLIYMNPTHWIYLHDLVQEPGKEEY